LDEYDDPDSEWPFMLRITQWLIDSTPDVCNITEWPIPTTLPAPLSLPMDIVLIAGGVGVVVIILVAVSLKKR
jgi:hypothetical protein